MPSHSSAPKVELGDEADLEAMLAKAEQLVNQIKETSESSRTGSSPSFLLIKHPVPDAIEMKDCATECSSVGYGRLSSTDDSCSIKKAASVNASFAEEWEAKELFVANTMPCVNNGVEEVLREHDEIKSGGDVSRWKLYPAVLPAACCSNFSFPANAELSPNEPENLNVDLPFIKQATRPTTRASDCLPNSEEATFEADGATVFQTMGMQQLKATVNADSTQIGEYMPAVPIENVTSSTKQRVQFDSSPKQANEQKVEIIPGKQPECTMHFNGNKSHWKGTAVNGDAAVEAAERMDLHLKEALSSPFYHATFMNSSVKMVKSIDVAPSSGQLVKIEESFGDSACEEQKIDIASMKAIYHHISNNIHSEGASNDDTQGMELHSKDTSNMDSTTINADGLKVANYLPASPIVNSPLLGGKSYRLLQVEPRSLSEEQKAHVPSTSQREAPAQHVFYNTTPRVETISVIEKDDDYVLSANYSCYSSHRSRPPVNGSRSRDDSAVHWEKVTSAYEGDDDYVPMSDYTSSLVLQVQELDNLALVQLTYSGHRAAIRRRRKTRRRRLVMLIAVSVFAMSFLLMRRYSAGVYTDHEGDIETKEEHGSLGLTEVTTYDSMPAEDEAWQAETHDEATTPDDNSDFVAVADENASHLHSEKIICKHPFIPFLSPTCSYKHDEKSRPPDAQERRRIVEDLVNSMMQ